MEKTELNDIREWQSRNMKHRTKGTLKSTNTEN